MQVALLQSSPVASQAPGFSQPSYNGTSTTNSSALIVEQEQLTSNLPKSSYNFMAQAQVPANASMAMNNHRPALMQNEDNDFICLASSDGSILYLAPEVFGNPSFTSVTQLIHPQDLDQFFRNVDLIVSSTSGLQLSIRLKTESNNYFLYTGIVRQKSNTGNDLPKTQGYILAFTRAQYLGQAPAQSSYYPAAQPFPPTPIINSAPSPLSHPSQNLQQTQQQVQQQPPPTAGGGMVGADPNPTGQSAALVAPNQRSTNLWLRRQAARQKNSAPSAPQPVSAVNSQTPAGVNISAGTMAAHNTMHNQASSPSASSTSSTQQNLMKSYESPEIGINPPGSAGAPQNAYLSIITPVSTESNSSVNYNYNPSPLYDSTVADSTYSSMPFSSTNSSFASPLDDPYWSGYTLRRPGASPFSPASSSPRFAYTSTPHSGTFYDQQAMNPPVVNVDRNQAGVYYNQPQSATAASSSHELVVPPTQPEDNMPLSATLPGKSSLNPQAAPSRGVPYWDNNQYASPQQPSFGNQPYYASQFYEDPSASAISLAQHQQYRLRDAKTYSLPGSLEASTGFDSGYPGYHLEHQPLIDGGYGMPPVKKKSKSKSGRKDDMDYQCSECGTVESPEWRKGPAGPKTLCNACGLRWAKRQRKGDTGRRGSAVSKR